MTKIKEIFTSIQGEGPFVGYKQLFVRFCGCNLNCKYCDTDFDIFTAKDYTPEELAFICRRYGNCHSISLTGGEPLLNIDFLQKFLPLCNLPVYLETNGTLCEELEDIIDFITYISMDIKLPSCTSLKPMWDFHDDFLAVSKAKNTFAKVVFDENITQEEIEASAKLCSKHDVELILQPKMNGKLLSVSSDFISSTLDKFLQLHSKTRLIPQVHKFIDVL